MSYTTIDVEQKDTVLIVRILKPRVFLNVAEKLKEEFIPLTERSFDVLLVDLGKVEVMNSSGLGVLILARDIVAEKKGRMAISGLTPLMSDIFSRMKLNLLFHVFPTEEEALSRLKGTP